ncbi:MAG: exopolysaccharide biosynthesis protein [Hyphomicrobiales bacterium]|nr:exopolysaccharide biosynthesis protein [Rickettsiales bacterium]MCP5361397.1 exopolysaccharide biosynthesis protein [Hyphomicrobiales bacterium]
MANGLSTRLQHMANTYQHQTQVPFGQLVDDLKEGGFCLLLILFSSPTALPLPAIPGLTFILSLPVLLLSLQLLIGLRTPWLPRWLRRKELKGKTLNHILTKLAGYVVKIEHILKPRLRFLSSRPGEQLLGLVFLILGISVALPFPLTNTIPSMGIIIIAVGLLERDGLAMLAGMAVGAAGITLAILVYFLGLEAIKTLF